MRAVGRWATLGAAVGLACAPAITQAATGFIGGEPRVVRYEITSSVPKQASGWLDQTGFERTGNRIEVAMGIGVCVPNANPAYSPIVAIRSGRFRYSGVSYAMYDFSSGKLTPIPKAWMTVTGSVSAQKVTGTLRQWGPGCDSHPIRFTAPLQTY
ncbi:MAG: hypothetical protein ACLP50_07750 [Solirubrobacteraceae bacterium]